MDPAIAADPDQLHQSWSELKKNQQQVEQLYPRWDELEQKNEDGR